MKKIPLLLITILGVTGLFAQDGNPFAEYGYHFPVVTATNGRFQEIHDNEEVVVIGTVLFHTSADTVMGEFVPDTAILQIEPQTVGICRFLTPDPLAEKYYHISPYAYVANNPIKYIDPDGRKIVITGALSDEALRQLQHRAGDRLTLTKSDDGNITYSQNGDGKLRGDAKRIAGMIDDNSITVNMGTTSSNETSTGNYFIGGAFMGNEVQRDEDNNITVTANQEVNPNVLGAADEHTETLGKLTMHEATEAYQGAKISQKKGISSPNSASPGTVYQRAHRRATPQTPVHQVMYDREGNQTQNINSAARVEWYVERNGRRKVIQTLQ
ncbi:MAG: hypothetical protein LBQ60_06730 [Bacteroidales bacterium]|jgi:hypothetical protein|nr:hypothetical protein [Bacteroidales bacterium]